MDSLNNLIREAEWEIESIDRNISRVLLEISDSLSQAKNLHNDNPGKPVFFDFDSKASQMSELSSLQGRRNTLIQSLINLRSLIN